MLHKIVTAVVLVPLAIVIIAFAVANRARVTVVFDPFDQSNPAYALTLQLWMLIVLAVTLGIILGGIAAWLRQGKWRRLARRLDAEVRELRSARDTGAPRQIFTRSPPPDRAPPLSIPPPG